MIGREYSIKFLLFSDVEFVRLFVAAPYLNNIYILFSKFISLTS
jgi:hypothetical protein